MSTRLKTLKGKVEISSTNLKPTYRKEKVVLRSFYGGNVRGKSLSITIGTENIQLDNKTVLELVEILINNYN